MFLWGFYIPPQGKFKEGDRVLKVLSLFSGIGAFEKALTNLEVDYELFCMMLDENGDIYV